MASFLGCPMREEGWERLGLLKPPESQSPWAHLALDIRCASGASGAVTARGDRDLRTISRPLISPWCRSFARISPGAAALSVPSASAHVHFQG